MDLQLRRIWSDWGCEKGGVSNMITVSYATYGGSDYCRSKEWWKSLVCLSTTPSKPLRRWNQDNTASTALLDPMVGLDLSLSEMEDDKMKRGGRNSEIPSLRYHTPSCHGSFTASFTRPVGYQGTARAFALPWCHLIKYYMASYLNDWSLIIKASFPLISMQEASKHQTMPRKRLATFNCSLVLVVFGIS